MLSPNHKEGLWEVGGHLTFQESWETCYLSPLPPLIIPCRVYTLTTSILTSLTIPILHLCTPTQATLSPQRSRVSKACRWSREVQKLANSHSVTEVSEWGSGTWTHWGQGTNHCVIPPRQPPLQYSCLENPVARGAWWAAVHGVTQSRTQLKRLSSGSLLSLEYYFFIPSSLGSENCKEIILEYHTHSPVYVRCWKTVQITMVS